MKMVRSTVSTPHPALSSVEEERESTRPTSNIEHPTSNIERCSIEERESALRALLCAVRIWNSRLSRYSESAK